MALMVGLTSGTHPDCQSRGGHGPWHRGGLAQGALGAPSRFAALAALVTLTVRAAARDARHGPCLWEATKTRPSVILFVMLSTLFAIFPLDTCNGSIS